METARLRDRLARILDRGIGRREAEMEQETGPGHGQESIPARLQAREEQVRRERPEHEREEIRHQYRNLGDKHDS